MRNPLLDPARRVFPIIREWTGETFFPDVCSFCGTRLKESEKGPIHLLCRTCHAKLPIRYRSQQILPCIDNRDYYNIQAKNRGTNPPVYVSCHYEEPIRKALVQYKFYEAGYMKETLGSILHFVFSSEIQNLDYLIPIPLHPDRFRERGYNQSALIAEKIAKISQKPLLSDCLYRIRNTQRQSEMKNRSERIANVEGAFRCIASDRIIQRNIGVVDDVLTSGSTLYAAIQAIYAATTKYSKGKKKYAVNVIGIVVASDR
jgi:ComF family protein